MIAKTKISKNQKTVIILLSMVPLIIIGYWGNMNNSEYSTSDLIVKYPTIIDLKVAVDSGELDYNKLPMGAKMALDEFNKGQSILDGLK